SAHADRDAVARPATLALARNELPQAVSQTSFANDPARREFNRQGNSSERLTSPPQTRRSSVSPDTGRPASPQSRSPDIVRPQSSQAEPSVAQTMTPNYSRSQTTSGPVLQNPARQRAPSISQPVARPSAQPHYLPVQHSAPSYAAPQAPRSTPVHTP